jgi:hypothetical protein
VDGGCCLALVEPGAGGEHLVEPVRPECLAGLGDQLGPTPPHGRPCSQPGPSAQALGRPHQQRRLLGLAASNGSRANAARHSDTLRVLWIATLRFSASSSSSLLLVAAAHSTS